MVKKEIVWAINLVIIRISKFYEYCLTRSKELLVCVVCLNCAFKKSIHVQTQQKNKMPQQKIDLKKAFIHNVEKWPNILQKSCSVLTLKFYSIFGHFSIL